MEAKTTSYHGMIYGDEMECTYLEKHLGDSSHNKSFIVLAEACRHGHEQDHVPSWKLHLQLLIYNIVHSNLNCNNAESNKLIKPVFSISDKLSKLFGLELKVNHLFFVGNVVMRHKVCHYL